jgi:hypothetical protein
VGVEVAVVGLEGPLDAAGRGAAALVARLLRHVLDVDDVLDIDRPVLLPHVRLRRALVRNVPVGHRRIVGRHGVVAGIEDVGGIRIVAAASIAAGGERGDEQQAQHGTRTRLAAHSSPPSVPSTGGIRRLP